MTRALRGRAAMLSVLAAAMLLAGCATQQAPLAVEPPREAAPDPADPARRAQVRLELAAAYFSRGQLETALGEVNLALQSKPDLPDAYNLRGLIEAANGEVAKAEESFRRALQLNPRDGDTMHNYGWLLCESKRFGDAEAQFRSALALPRYVNSARTLMAQGICQARAGRMDLAETTLARSYELDPANPVTAVNLTEVLYRRGEFERARFYIRRVNGQQDLSNAQTLWLAARIERKLNNPSGVSVFGKQLTDRFPQSREAGAYARGEFDE